MSHHAADVAVVGAGLAGLTCADVLRKHGVDVLVLEARDRVGGRAFSAELDGEVVELGGQFLGPGQDRVYALAEELGLRIFPTYNTGVHLVENPSGRIRRFRGTILRLSPLALADVAQAAGRFERLARTIDLEAPWLSPRAGVLDGATLESWIRRRVRTQAGRRLFTMACELLWACEPNELSLLHALFYTRSAGSLQALISVDGGAQQDRLDGGTQELAVRLATRLGDRIRLDSPVRRIWQDEHGVRIMTGSGETLQATRTVVAIPPTLAGRIEYDPPLPAARDGLTQRLAMGSVVKCMIVYPEPFWRTYGLSGQALSLRGPIAGIADSSPLSGGRGVLVGVLEGAAARRLALLPAEARQALVIDELTRLFGTEAAHPAAYLEQDWNAEPFTRGAYAALFPPGAWSQYGHALRPQTGRIHWAGTETATCWYGYLEGAVRSGETTAAEIILSLRS